MKVRSIGHQPEFTPQDGIRVQRQVLAAYLNPPVFKPGDIVQSRRHFATWPGVPPRVAYPLMVLEYHPDLYVMTNENSDRGVPGIKFVTLDPPAEGILFHFDHAWHFELYDGPKPDEH